MSGVILNMINKYSIYSMVVFIIGQVVLQLKLFTPIGLLITIIFLFINFFIINYFIPKIISNKKFYIIKNILSNNLIYFLLFFALIFLYDSIPLNKINIYYSYILLQFLLAILTNMTYLKER